MHKNLRAQSEDLSIKAQIEARYQAILHRVMATLKRHLLDMDPSTNWARGYEMIFVKEVLGNITTFFRELCPIDDFFKDVLGLLHEDTAWKVIHILRNYG